MSSVDEEQTQPQSFQLVVQVALRVGSWMAGAKCGPADTAAASDFRRGLSEPQRLAVVAQAHAIIGAVLEHSAPAAQLDSASQRQHQLPHSDALAAEPAAGPQHAAGAAAAKQGCTDAPQQRCQQQHQQQRITVPSPRRSEAPRRSISSVGSHGDLYSAFANAAVGVAAAPTDSDTALQRPRRSSSDAAAQDCTQHSQSGAAAEPQHQ